MPVRPGPANLLTDVGGILVGSAHDSAVETGATVIRPVNRAVAAVAVAGGGPGTRETDALAPDTLVDAVDAIVFSGGSVYGLAAADGVTAKLGASGHGFALRAAPGVPVSPIVPSAILYDLANGGDKAWGEAPPYRQLGIDALGACSVHFELGRAGAGFGARAGQQRGGLGSASAVTDDGVIVGALAAVNSHGSVLMPGTNAYWAWPYEQQGEFGGARPLQDFALDLDDWGEAKTSPAAMLSRANTTLGCVAVNVALTPAEARRVARMALAGLARAIRPVFAPFDGDVVFCLSTGAIERPDLRPFVLARLGELAAACLARAVARGVHAARQD
ncbi:MAG: P1 family peptidase [Alphaproteobacteria bacterium]|nr:P1 family peptidase [Alphaproteobacteria bacterium]